MKIIFDLRPVTKLYSLTFWDTIKTTLHGLQTF